MRKNLLNVLAAIILVSCAKGESDLQLSTDFSISDDSLYMLEELDVESSNRSGDSASYHWDFGDGNSALGFQAKHQYNKEGEYRVSLRIGANVSTKDVHVLPGHLSYQIENGSSKPLLLRGYINTPETGQTLQVTLLPEEFTDTVFAKVQAVGAKQLTGIIFQQGDGTEYTTYDIPWIDDRKHEVVVVTDTMKVISVKGSSIKTIADL